MWSSPFTSYLFSSPTFFSASSEVWEENSLKFDNDEDDYDEDKDDYDDDVDVRGKSMMQYNVQ